MATILVVEDEEFDPTHMRDFLKSRGYNILVASEGVGAIKQLLDNKVDLIVTDYRMSLFGGDYWLRFLQRFCPEQNVILTSGFLKPETKVPYPILYKPYEYKELEAQIAKTLE